MDAKSEEVLNKIIPKGNILPALAVAWWNQIPELAAFKAVYCLPVVLDMGVTTEQFVKDAGRVIKFMEVWAEVLQIEEETYRRFSKEEQGRIAWFGKVFDWLRTSKTMIAPGHFLPTGVGIAAAMQGVFAMLDAAGVTREERKKAADFIHSWARGIREIKEGRMKTVEVPKKPDLKPRGSNYSKPEDDGGF